MKSREERSSEFEAALLALNRLEVARLLTDEGDERPVTARIEQDVVPAMDRLGRLWEDGRVSLSQVYMSGRICEELVGRLLPQHAEPSDGDARIALAVLEDRHMLGKRMVAATLTASGHPFFDYGSTDAEALVRRVEADGVEMLLVSTLMLNSALRVVKVREGLDRLGRPVMLVVGGAPFRLEPGLWRETGADAMCRNASEIVSLIDRFSGGGR